MELQARCRRRVIALSINLSHDVGRVDAHPRADWLEFPLSQPWKSTLILGSIRLTCGQHGLCGLRLPVPRILVSWIGVHCDD